MAKSNLGSYQTFVELAKKVGGPVQLAICIGIAGYAIIRPIEAGIKKVSKKGRSAKKAKEYSFTKKGSYNSFHFNSGDHFFVVATTDDGVLIEILDNDHNPHFVPISFLRECSNYI